MEIEEARRLRVETDVKITELVREYQERTSLVVLGIHATSSVERSLVSGSCVLIPRKFRIEVESI